MAREGTPDDKVIREVEPVLAARGFREINISARKGKALAYNIDQLHVDFAPDPINAASSGLDIRNLWKCKKIPLLAGTSVTLDFKSNERLERHLGLCGKCICRTCKCNISTSTSSGKRARDARLSRVPRQPAAARPLP